MADTAEDNRDAAPESLAGFLLSRNWRDTPDGVELEFWFASEQGPICALVDTERAVAFLRATDLSSASPQLDRDCEARPLALKDFDGNPVVGLYHCSYRRARDQAERLRAVGLEPLEADINPADRYLMERFIQGGATLRGAFQWRGDHWLVSNPVLRAAECRPSLRWVSFDIETAMEGVQLYSIAVHGIDGERETRRVFMIGAGATQDFVEPVADQQALLARFLDWIAEYDPDVLVGWNVINFDTWYLQQVAERAGGRLLLGRGRRPVHWRELDDEGLRRAVQCPGRVILDGIDLLRAAFYRFESFALERVASELLGEGKLIKGGDRGEEIGRLFREDKTALAAYNLRDCELVTDIFRRTALLDFAVARSAMTGLNMDRMGGSVASFDNLYLPRLHRAGFVAPNAPAQVPDSPGGFVLDSQPGIYQHVLVLDFKSLYPSIIRTFCIDPLGLALASAGELADDATVAGFRGGRFAREGHILPALITTLWQQRDAAKVAGDQPLSQAIKIIMNSFYGVLGSPGCRFFDGRLASSITLRGHQILQETRDYIERAGHRVIYGDTDSVFVWIQDADSDAAADRAGRALERALNGWWRQRIADEFGLECALELEFETHFQRFLMPTVRGTDKGSKKRYAGVVTTPEGPKLVFKGLENVRTDWTRLARDFQQQLYQRVFAEEPYDDYVRMVVEALRAGRLDNELVYRKRLRRRLADYEKNVPPHVQAARLYGGRGLPEPHRGDWVEYVVTAAGAEPAAAPLAPLDYEHYLERQLQPVADGVLGFLGTSFDELVNAQLGLF